MFEMILRREFVYWLVLGLADPPNAQTGKKLKNVEYRLPNLDLFSSQVGLGDKTESLGQCP
jgi:hypothetical protein